MYHPKYNNTRRHNSWWREYNNYPLIVGHINAVGSVQPVRQQEKPHSRSVMCLYLSCALKHDEIRLWSVFVEVLIFMKPSTNS